MTLMEYLKGNPGSLHYTADIPTEPFGKKGQLKVARSTKTLEVFADIAYSAGSRHRSVQGLAIYFAGCPIAWQTSLQPFVTHSTAESELVSYCDGLNAGRSAEAMICSMLGIQPGTAELDRVLYGDNVAAIALAHGTGNASWRTRHLRIRSSYLREALDGVAPGGTWKLLHVKGVDLVADGLTKPLHGQAFRAFIEELGMPNQTQPEQEHPQQEGGMPSHAAVVAMMTGSLLLSGADAGEETGDDTETNVIWACGAILMALGAFYASQLAFRGVRCCLRSLQELSRGRDKLEEDKLPSFRDGSATADGTSVTIQHGAGSSSSSNPSSTSLSISIQSGSQHRDENPPVEVQLPTSSSTASGSAAVQLPTSTSTASGSAVPAASGLRARAAAAVSEDRQSPKEIVNPWNQFQHDYRGKGFSKATLAKMYKYQKDKDNKMP